MNRLFILLLLTIAIVTGSCVKNADVQPQSITLNYTDLTLQAGSGKQLLASRYDATQIIWTSSDSTVASINEKGIIMALKEGTTLMTAKSKQYNVTATCTVKVTPLIVEGKDIGIGADGSVFIIGTDSTSSSSGYSISKLVNNTLTKLPDCGAVRVAVDPKGMPWVVTKLHTILKYNGATWVTIPGAATDIGIGANGSVYAIGNIEVSPTGGNNIMRWNGTAWETMPDCAGTRIAVAPDGTPWVVNKSNLVYKYTGNYLWDPMYNIYAYDIGIGANGAVFVTGMRLGSNDIHVYQWNNFSYDWTDLNVLGGNNISVTPDGHAWWLDKNNILQKR